MKISIIIPAYNAEKTIEKCLDSILRQTYNNLEVIVINDGSTDSTDSILQKYKEIDSRIVYIKNNNKGVSYSRNYGIKIASGDYLTFVDSDDYLDIDCYESLVKIIRNSEYDFIRYNLKIDGKGGFCNNMYELANTNINLLNNPEIVTHFFYNYKKMPCLVMLLLIKKSIAKQLIFNENLTMMEDTDFYLQLFLKSKNCYFADIKKYNYYINQASVSHNYNYYKKNIFGILNTNQSLKEKINSSSLKLDVKLIDANHLRIISNYLKRIFKHDKKDYKAVIQELKSNDIFNSIIINYKYMNLKDSIYIGLIKNKKEVLEYIYISLCTTINEIKEKIKK